MELVSANVEERSDIEKVFDDRLNRFRQRIESTFNSIQNNDRNLEWLLAKTIQGFCLRVIAKITIYTLKLVLYRFFGLEVQTSHPIKGQNIIAHQASDS